MDHFRLRLRKVFDQYLSHRRNTGIIVPTFPDGCTETSKVADELKELITTISNEETFIFWLDANINAVCGDQSEEITDLIEKHMPTLESMQ